MKKHKDNMVPLANSLTSPEQVRTPLTVYTLMQTLICGALRSFLPCKGLLQPVGRI